MSELTEPLYYGIHPLVCPLEETGKVGKYSTENINCSIDSLLPEQNKDIDANYPYEMSLRSISILFLLMSSLCLIFILLLLIKMAQKVNEINTQESDVIYEENENTEEIIETDNKVAIKKDEKEVINEKRRTPSLMNSPSLLFGFGDNNYKKACRLSEMIIVFVNNYMNEWYKKVTTDEEEDVKKWHPYLLTNDIEISGFIAWLFWSAIHILYLIGYRSKILVVIEWIFSYLFNKKGTRLIYREPT